MCTVSPSDLTLGHLNIFHLENKVTDVNVFLDQARMHHIFGVTESRLSSNVSDELLEIPNYTIFRRDSTVSGHTGIAVYIHDCIKHLTIRRFDLESVTVESIWFEVKVSKCPVMVGFVYRNPSSNFSWYDDFVVMMDKVQNIMHGQDIIILGDFNIDLQKNHSAWDSTISLFNLNQLIQSPTRVTVTSATLIDHIYVNNLNRVIIAEVKQTSMSDHFTVQCTLASKVPKVRSGTHSTIVYRSFKRFNETAFLSDLSNCSFDDIYKSSDPDVALQSFQKIFSTVYNKHAPIRNKRVKNVSIPPWFTIDIKIATNIRDKFKKEKNYSAFKQQRKYVKYLVRQAKKNYFNKLTVSNSVSNIWKALNTLTSKSFPDKAPKTGCFSASDFNHHFLSIAKHLTNTTAQKSKQYQYSNELKMFCSTKLSPQDTFYIPEIAVHEVGKYISNLGHKTSHGNDGLSNKILLLSLPYIVHHLTYIYNQSISNNYFPRLFKVAKVLPLPKRKNPSNLNDYRPISILPSLSKPLEKHVHKHLLQYLDQHELLHQQQSGFRPKHSCQTALTHFIDKLLTSINEKQLNGVVFLDFKKAFDLVNHEILLKKLSIYQIDSNTVAFFNSYLKDRTQSVIVNGISSPQGLVKTGIPQGSVLGPLLFNIYINDLPLCITPPEVSCDMFADDSSLVTSGTDLQRINDKLQLSLTEVSHWCSNNRMLLNPEKTKCMIITTRQKHQRQLLTLNLSVEDQVIQQVKEHRHLGILIDNEIKWEAHINSLTKSIAKNVYLLSRLKPVVNPEACYFFFNSYIMSKINYVSNVWDCCSDVHLNKLNSVYKRAVKILLKNVPMMNKQLLIPLSLTQHLKFNKCTLMHKIIHGKCPAYLEQNIGCYVRGNPHSRCGTLILPKPRIDLFKSSLTYSGTSCWNSLPKNLKEPLSTKTFKAKLQYYIRSNPTN